MQPPANMPPFVRTDGSNAFAQDTFNRRIPAIIRETMELNSDYPDQILQALQDLHDSIVNDEPMPMLTFPAPDYASWLVDWEANKQDTWLNSYWYFSETFMYRHMLGATRWWETRRDLFRPRKMQEYRSEAHWKLLNAALEIDQSDPANLQEIVSLPLWGNRIDLSFEASLERGFEAAEEDLMTDDSSQIVDQLLNGTGPVHIVTDNAGSELTMDFVLVDTLLKMQVPVLMHVKMHPTYVSDATVEDVLSFFGMLLSGDYVQPALAFGQRLRTALDEGRLRLMPDFFWNSARYLWQAPPHIEAHFHDARLVIVKGDANYRRVLGDVLWAPDTPYAEVASYFPAPIANLRTMKSDTILGLAPGQAEKLDAVDPNWRVNGQRGVIHFAANAVHR